MYLLILFCITFSGTIFSAQITNNIDGVGPQGLTRPYICVQNTAGQVGLILAPNQSGDANQASGNKYYAGASLRFGGCNPDNSYLGYIGFSVDASGHNSISGYSPPNGVHVVYSQPNIDSNGVVGGAIRYTPIEFNPTLHQPQVTPNTFFAGINLSGLEFGQVIEPFVIPNLSNADSKSIQSDLKDTNAFIDGGMNTIRVPISWGYLQLDGPGVGPINLGYYENYIRPLLQTLTQAHVYTMIDLHAYMRYSKFGHEYSGCGANGKCPDGTLILDPAAYQSVWGQLFSLIQQDQTIDKQYIMLDLVNEPVGIPDDKVFTIQAGLITFLRNQGFDGYILVEGNNWSGLHSWATETWTGAAGKIYSNATLFTRKNFARAGITDLSKILINVHQYLDSNYSGTHDDCQQNLETTGPSGFNLKLFANYLKDNELQAIVTEFGTGKNADSCRAPLTKFMQYLQDNTATNQSGGFVGWTIWSAGHGWGDYNLRVKPGSYHMSILKAALDHTL